MEERAVRWVRLDADVCLELYVNEIELEAFDIDEQCRCGLVLVTGT